MISRITFCSAQPAMILSARFGPMMPDLTLAEGGDFFFVDAADPEQGVAKLLAIVKERIPKRFGFDPIRDIQVLCPMNRGGLGARSLNIELQTALNQPGEIRIERFGWTFCPGDKVMQVENDYDKEVYNGDLGVVSRIDMEEGELTVDFDGRDLTYGLSTDGRNESLISSLG
jgi:exodeoxyribonuclease V alpha subunit